MNENNEIFGSLYLTSVNSTEDIKTVTSERTKSKKTTKTEFKRNSHITTSSLPKLKTYNFSISSKYRLTTQRKFPKPTEIRTVSTTHSSFQEQNYKDYYTSCNKFKTTLPEIFKMKYEPHRFIKNTRKYTENEARYISKLNKEEVMNRSPGRGMFIKLQNYREANRRIPLQLIQRELLLIGNSKSPKMDKLKNMLVSKIEKKIKGVKVVYGK